MDSVWNQGKEKLRRYLKAECHKNKRHYMYGAITDRKYVQFVKYEPKARDLIALKYTQSHCGLRGNVAQYTNFRIHVGQALVTLRKLQITGEWKITFNFWRDENWFGFEHLVGQNARIIYTNREGLWGRLPAPTRSRENRGQSAGQ